MGDCQDRLQETRKALRPYQRKLYAAKQFSVLLVFQALDAAGKDGVIREVFEDLQVAPFGAKPGYRQEAAQWLELLDQPLDRLEIALGCGGTDLQDEAVAFDA